MPNRDIRRPTPHSQWVGKESEIIRHVKSVSTQCLNAYRANPQLVSEHANIEIATAQGGYGRRQVYELVQNGADALVGHENGRIHIILTDAALYCANQGDPITPEGIDAIMHSHLSRKRGVEIGRFGLGFKSVLGVTTRPEFYSRTGSFGFDADYSAEKIRGIVPTAERFPVLRLAFSLDAAKAAKVDECLGQVMGWASSVIKLPRSSWKSDWLSEDVRNFPAEFLLFSPHVGELVLEDRTGNHNRTIRLQKGGEGRHRDSIALSVGEKTSIWKVFETQHKPTKAARETAGELSDRESLPLMWAVPIGGRQERGKFWAFFPTEYYTTLSGIVNAPWKTNEDRQNLLTGVFNEEMIRAAARLVAANLPQVVTPEDPGRFLELLPARGREAPNWADEKITEATYAEVSKVSCLPDQDGILRLVSKVRLHPDGLPPEALLAWASYSSRPQNWCHHSVQPTSRRSRVERLFSLDKRVSATIVEWLEALVEDRTPEASLAAVKTAAAIVARATPAAASEARSAKIILTADGKLVPADPRVVFTARDGAASETGVLTVHPAIIEAEGGRDAVRALGINDVDASSELRSLLARTELRLTTAGEWENFWSLVRRLPAETAVGLIGNRKNGVRVRTLVGAFLPLRQTLLPGPIVPADGSRDRGVTIDITFHAEEMPILRELGAVDGPKPDGGSAQENWFEAFRHTVVEQYLNSLPRNLRPQKNMLVFKGRPMVGPLDVIESLSEEGRARFTESLFSAGVDDKPWVLEHETQLEKYPSQPLEPPYIWVARRHGRLLTSLGYRLPSKCVGPALSRWSGVLPTADCSRKAADKLMLPETMSKLRAGHWEAAFSVVQEMNDDALIGAFYAEACRFVLPDVLPTAGLRCRSGHGLTLKPRIKVAVTADPALIEPLTALGTPFLQVPFAEDEADLIRRWGLLQADVFVTREVRAVPSGSEVPLADRFPGIETYVTEVQALLELIPCASVRVETVTAAGTQTDDHDLFLDDNRLFYSDTVNNEDLLDRITELLDLKISPEDRDDILELRLLTERRERLHAVRRLSTPSEKLTAAIGTAELRRRLPTGLTAAAEQEYGTLNDDTLAQLALAAFGVDTLHTYRDELQKNGFGPPLQWAGSYGARTFVQGLGFPREFAGFAQSRRDAVLEVDGPSRLPTLHNFQSTIVAEIRQLLVEAESTRGLLSLPTGAGKTRVAVEALIQSLSAGDLEGPVLWVAQSDELCEQAVRSWTEVWRAVGPQTSLHINRLWGANEADWYGDGPQVVVATIQKIQGCITDPDYEWLKTPTCVIVDEAHLSTEPSYTKLFEWVGLGRRGQRCPLLGLTATPYRGSEPETVRLVSRYGRRLEGGVLGDDPYRQLQAMDILAQVDHRVLTGSDIQLSPEELDALQRLRRLPSTAGERIGRDEARNRAILQSIRSLPPDWPVLLFAASVEHAATLAALLTMDGISAASVSAETGAGARRHYVERFRAGDLRILTNYGVLTTGFDAPAVRAIYVTRPTFSPILYQQMIGRGLRGPGNGGKERCLIVNVEDNILQYGEALAFRQFDYLWDSETHDADA